MNSRHCFDVDGKIDLEKIKNLKQILGDPTKFSQEPFSKLGNVNFIRTQMLCVLDHILNNSDGLCDILSGANMPYDQLASQGKAIVDIMSRKGGQQLKSAEVILASLFSPSRQSNLPTCAIFSIINTEIRNHPARLAGIYKQIMEKGEFNFPSGYLVQAAQVDRREDAHDYVTVNLIN